MSRLVILSPTQLKLDGLYSNPVRWRHDISMIGSPSISIIFIHQLFPHLVWSLYEDPDRQPRIINLRWANAEASKDGADCVCVCVCGGLASRTQRPAPHLARLQSRLPLWPGEQLSPLGGISIQRGGGGRLTCPLAQAQWEWDETVLHSVWCLCPSGLQIIVNVPAGTFHWRM